MPFKAKIAFLLSCTLPDIWIVLKILLHNSACCQFQKYINPFSCPAVGTTNTSKFTYILVNVEAVWPGNVKVGKSSPSSKSL